MGWKAIKKHYKIEHFVQVTSQGICIGSPYIHNIIVIKDGVPTTPNRSLQSRFANADLDRYWDEMHADLGKLKELAESEDSFKRSLTVYTYQDGKVVEKKCEELGYPNVTYDGQMMYENTHFEDREDAVKKAIEDETSAIKWRTERIAELAEKTSELQAQVDESRNRIRSLGA